MSRSESDIVGINGRRRRMGRSGAGLWKSIKGKNNVAENIADEIKSNETFPSASRRSSLPMKFPDTDGSTRSSSSHGSHSEKSDREESDREESDIFHPDRMSENLLAVPGFTKKDFIMGPFLGKGSFSDVFEVTVVERESTSPSPDNDSGDEDLDGLIDQMFKPLSLDATPEHGIREGTSINLPGTEVILAMKRLRPPRDSSEEEHYEIGAADLAHESAILSSLNHPHIIKIRGRAADLSSQAQFILVDWLRDTLVHRLKDWKKSCSTKLPPSKKRIGVAICIADALRYLHANNIAFRDLKPPNIGFDSFGMPKLFDFGFAASVPPLTEKDKENGRLGSLGDKCGTVRFMAPEVGLSKGHGVEADIYSFGLLLWEICALKTPFENLHCAEKFRTEVWTKGKRPSLSGNWPSSLRDQVDMCWDNDPKERPSMKVVWAALRDYSSRIDAEAAGDGPPARRQRGASIRCAMRRSLSLPEKISPGLL